MSALALTASGLVATLAPTVTQAATGANVALASAGGTVTASGNEVADGRWTPDKAIDGDQTGSASRWSSNYSDTAWITVKLAAPTTIDHVKIYWEAACAATYKLQVSNDGTTFTDATAVITPTCGQADSQTLNAATAGTAWQYVRMQALSRTPIGTQKWGVSLFEFEVWNGVEPAPVVPKVNLVPLPLEVTEGEGSFTLDANTKIEASGAAAPVANLLAERMRASTGLPLPVVASAATNSIRFVLDANYAELGTASPGEGYKLEVTPTGAVITAKAAHGLWNGSATLRQLFPPMIESKTKVIGDWVAPVVTVQDAPRFSHRGIQIDSARSFVTVPEVKKIIDTISSYKQSRVHLHVADDQGWRLEITNEGKEAGDPVDYTALTRVSGQSSMLAHPNNANKELGISGYYTQADYSEIVRYAAERFVTIIPEIDVPGHTKALLHAIPELNSAGSRPFPTVYGTTKEQNNGNVGESTLDVNNPQTWVSLRHIFKQLVAITPGPWIHIGGDESHVTPHDDYVEFVKRSKAIAVDLGKATMGWNEYAEAPAVGAGDVVQYWVGSTTYTNQAIARGAKVVVSKASASYLDMKYNPKTPLGLTWAGQGDIDHYYNWNPATDAGLTVADESSILGVEAPLWSETHRRGDNNEFMIFPRAISHAEIGWTKQSSRNFANFAQRMSAVGPRLAASASNFYDGRLVAWGTDAAGLEAKAGTGKDVRVDVAHLVAPGTKASADGTSVAKDAVDDADGASNSALTAPLTAMIDFGDGTAAVQATFATERPRNATSAAGTYQVGAKHAYAASGTRDVTVTFSDGRVVKGKVTVTDGYVAPAKPVIDECLAPQMTLADATSRDDSRNKVTLSGFKANEFLKVHWDLHTIPAGTSGADLDAARQARFVGTVLSDENGNATFHHYIPYQSIKGDHTLRVTDSADRFVEKVITVDSQTIQPKGKVVTGITATASSQATNEPSPNGYAAAMVDGLATTYWHSQWSTPAATYPHTLTFDLGKVYNLSSIGWTPRQGNTNGLVKGVEIYTSTDGTTWGTAAKTLDLPNGADTTVIPFEVGTRYVQIIARSPQTAASPFAAVAEMTFRGLLPGETEPEVQPVVAATWTKPAECGTTTPPVTTPPVTTPPVTTPPVTTPPVTTPPVTTPPVTTPPVTTPPVTTPPVTTPPVTTPPVTTRPVTTPPATPSAGATWFPVGGVYVTPGYHEVNGRKWFTRCEPYSATFRCRTDIWATQVRYLGAGKFTSVTGWHFNNLTYLPSARSLWATNPLGKPGSWVSNGRTWRTECDTAATGRNACRSYIWTTNIGSAKLGANGVYTYTLRNDWVFNNIVLFKPGS